jgi:hypothetical protein
MDKLQATRIGLDRCFAVTFLNKVSTTYFQTMLSEVMCATEHIENKLIFNRGGIMFKTSIAIAAVSFSAFGLSACDVDKTQEGSVTVPKYEVEQKQAGNVTAPGYDVKTPDVAVTEQEKKVEVPTIEKEEKTVTVPKVEVEPATEK